MELSAADVIHPKDRRFWLYDAMFAIDEKDGMHLPRFSVQEAAKCFFGEGPEWLRWRMRPERPGTKRCPTCKATGILVIEGAALEEGGYKECPDCRGVGYQTTPPKHPNGFFLLDGEPLEFKRVKSSDPGKSDDPNLSTARYYTLADVERMAHALHQQDIISESRLSSIILAIRAVAYLYGLAEVRLPVAGADTPDLDPDDAPMDLTGITG